MCKELIQKVMTSIFNTLDDYVCYDYAKGNNEYIIIDVEGLAKEEFNETIDNNSIKEVFIDLSNNTFWKTVISSVELLNTELKINLY